MASPSTARRPLSEFVADACENDDVSLMATLITQASKLNDKTHLNKMLLKSLKHAARKGSIDVLSYVIEQGAEVSQLKGHHITDNGCDVPTRKTLDVLVSHGWDIDSRGPTLGGLPLLWYIAGDHELVEWCLAHGASVDLPDDTPDGAVGKRRPNLVVAAGVSSIETFELLRSKGAPMSQGVLPQAVTSAKASAPKTGTDPLYTARLDMVKYLIDVIGVDANVPSWGSRFFCSTPLCRAACMPSGDGDGEELIEFLLDRGGDVHLSGPSGSIVLSAFEAAKQRGNRPFLRVVEKWQRKNQGDQSKSVAKQQTEEIRQ